MTLKSHFFVHAYKTNIVNNYSICVWTNFLVLYCIVLYTHYTEPKRKKKHSYKINLTIITILRVLINFNCLIGHKYFNFIFRLMFILLGQTAWMIKFIFQLLCVYLCAILVLCIRKKIRLFSFWYRFKLCERKQKQICHLSAINYW